MRFDSTLVRFGLFAPLLVLGLVLTEPLVHGQRGGLPSRSLPDEPMVFDTAEAGPIRVTPTKGLSHPWSLTFLPDGDILVTERPGRLRIVRDGILDPRPISGVPEVYATGLGGLMDIALHPQFSENGLVYMSYIKPIGEDDHTPALFRGRLEGMALVDGGDIFVSKSKVGGPVAGSGMIFGPDGNVYMAVGGAGIWRWAVRATMLRRIRLTTRGRWSGSLTTAALLPTIRLSTERGTCRKSIPWDIGTCWVSP